MHSGQARTFAISIFLHSLFRPGFAVSGLFLVSHLRYTPSDFEMGNLCPEVSVGKESAEMFEPLRFLHVAEVQLDGLLRDVGPVSLPVQSMARKATQTAFDRMIAGAIEQQVDFVLLAGNTFRETDRSLQARLQLVKSLQILHEQGIEVFVLPGIDDPESAWRKIPDLPGNVMLLPSGETTVEDPDPPVAVVRDGRVIATITSGPLDQFSENNTALTSPTDKEELTVGPPPSTNGHSRTAPFRVGLISAWPTEPNPQGSDTEDLTDRLSACHCDYLAVPASDTTDHSLGWHFEVGQTVNTQDGIAHNPGPLQPLASQDTGPHGATLIEVEQDGKIRGTFLPFASVRRLKFDVSIEPESQLEDVSETMRSQLENETAQQGEQAWLVQWALRGCGELFDSLRDPEMRDLLIESLPPVVSESEDVRIEHQMSFHEASLPFGHDETTNDLERLYREALELTVPKDDPTLKSAFETVRANVEQLDNPHWRERLLSLVPELDSQQISTKAHALGNEWFRCSPDDA